MMIGAFRTYTMFKCVPVPCRAVGWEENRFTPRGEITAEQRISSRSVRKTDVSQWIQAEVPVSQCCRQKNFRHFHLLSIPSICGKNHNMNQSQELTEVDKDVFGNSVLIREAAGLRKLVCRASDIVTAVSRSR